MAQTPLYSLDTHAQYWQLVDPTKLSAAAQSVFDEARGGRAILALSHVVLAELYFLFQKQRRGTDFSPFVQRVKKSGAYRIEAITMADLEQLPDFLEIPEMHDRLIAIQANRLDAILVTKDAAIRASPRVRSLW